MGAEMYIEKIKEILQKQLTHDEKVFVFGSSVENEKFGDVDLAVVSAQLVAEAEPTSGHEVMQSQQ